MVKLTQQEKNFVKKTITSLSQFSPNKNSTLNQAASKIKEDKDRKEKSKNTTYQNIYGIIKKAYAGKYGNIVNLTDRCFNANSTWRDIAKIINPLPKPNHYTGQNAVIRAILNAKLGKSNNTQTTSDDINSDFSDVSGGDYSSSSEGSSGTQTQSNPMLSGEQTFQEIIEEICSGIDLVFVCKKTNVVITDLETLYAEADYLRRNNQAKSEDIKLWQLEDGTYELDVNQYGMYNTVKVIYKNGVFVESYPDLVRIYGEVPKVYTHKNLNKTQAEQKAKSYLAAHLRDFNMTIKASILHDGGIDVGDMVTLDNPLTLNEKIKTLTGQTPTYYFVKGVNIDWDEGPIKCDLELTFAPESPDRPEIPEAGSGGYLYSNEDVTE